MWPQPKVTKGYSLSSPTDLDVNKHQCPSELGAADLNDLVLAEALERDGGSRRPTAPAETHPRALGRTGAAGVRCPSPVFLPQLGIGSPNPTPGKRQGAPELNACMWKLMFG